MKLQLAPALLAALLAGGLAAQEPTPTANADDPYAEQKAREQAARTAYQELNDQLMQLERPQDEEGQARFFTKVRTALDEFAGKWADTDVGFDARFNVGMIDIHVLDQADRGLEALGKVYQQVKERPKALLEGAQWTPARAGLVYAESLMDNERLEVAEKVLGELAEIEGPEGKQAQEMLGRIKALVATKVGLPLPTFTGTDLDGKELTPEQYRGKVVLIDFWATWCGPCVREMPHVVATYTEYHDQGFEVIGVSLDQEGQADQVRQFTEKNGMPWRQVYDGGYWNAAVAKQFAINSIPATILVDRKGIIRFKNLRGEALTKAVAELVGVEP